MKRMFVLTIVAGLLYAFSVIDHAQQRRRTVWEYTVLHDASVPDMNRLGTDGWEAVSAVQTPIGQIQVIMKRSKEE